VFRTRVIVRRFLRCATPGHCLACNVTSALIVTELLTLLIEPHVFSSTFRQRGQTMLHGPTN